MKHLITTRIKFKDDELLMEYLEISKQTFFPSIISQTNQNFILGIFSNEKHRGLIEGIIDVICEKLNKKKPQLIFLNNMNTDYVDYIFSENIDIQTRHDCDDWMCNTYVEQIQNIYSENIKKYSSFVIHGQPYKYDITEDKKYKMTYRYDGGNTSMFVSICQKKCDIQLFTLKHCDVGKSTEKVFMVDEGSCHLVIHDNNKMSTVTNKDILIK
jgi:hypothetical protein